MKSRKYSSDPLIPEYEGPLGRPKMSYEAQRGYDSFYQQKKRSKVFYTPRQFVHWWLENIKTRSHWEQPTCGRIDHSKWYSFDNIVMQEQSENTAERNSRHGNPGRKHRAVKAICEGIEKTFISKREAAEYYGVSEKTVYNHCQGRTTQHFRFGIGVKGKKAVVFEWI